VAEDVWTALVKGVLAFGQSRASDLVRDSFQDTGTLVHALGGGVNDQPTKDALHALEDDVKNLTAEGQVIVDVCKADIQSAADAVTACAADLAANPFTLAAAARAATEIANVLIAFDAALVKIAEKVSHKGDAAQFHQSVYDAIVGIDAPYKSAFANLGAGIGAALDAIASELLGEGDATKKLGEALKLDRAGKQLTMTLANSGERTPIPAFPAFTLDDTELTAFFTYKTTAAIGIRLKTKLKAGLRSDALLEKIIPDGAPSSDTDYTTISLDSDNGLTFGDGGSKTLMLPARFSFPGIELREFAIVLPDTGDASDQIDLKATIAGKLGVVAFIVEGAGIEIHYRPAAALPFDIGPRLPDAAGVSIDAGVVKGGGYIYRKGTEYGGILDLQLLAIGITVICIVNTDPFSMVVIISVRFLPKIELSFGFTLNGLGGILAIDRRVNTDALRQGIHDGTADTILFPSNPIEAAPKILDKVREIFPAQPGNFVVGPIALLGWGSQAGFIVAKVGIVLSLPDPKLILLGAVQIGVPSTEVPEALRIVDLRAEVYGEFTPEYLLLLIGLTNSKIANISISGDIGLFVRWAGGANFALSVGGFHPHYTPPPELAGMRRIVIELSPGGIPILKLTAEGYFAITANSLQVGGKISLRADVGAASAEAWIAIDALFVWSPHFYFEAQIAIGICVKVFGFTICGASFHGSLQGTTPWRIEGTATIDLGFFGSYDFNLGPVEWGERDTTPQPRVSPREIAALALAEAESWKPQLPEGGDMLVRLIRDETPLLVHPLGMLEVKQQKVPLETKIDRIGSNAVDAHFVNLALPKVSGADAAVVSHSNELFAAGHFIDLTKDQQVSQPDFESFPAGMKLCASRLPLHGTALGAAYQWDTCFPQEVHLGRVFQTVAFASLQRHVLRLGAVSQARRTRGNGYQVENPEKVSMADAGTVSIRGRDDLAAVAAAPGVMTTTAAIKLRQDLVAKGAPALELVALGVTK
jgi:hypothetical protein